MVFLVEADLEVGVVVVRLGREDEVGSVLGLVLLEVVRDVVLIVVAKEVALVEMAETGALVVVINDGEVSVVGWVTKEAGVVLGGLVGSSTPL